jgi:hypothetical protein
VLCSYLFAFALFMSSRNLLGLSSCPFAFLSLFWMRSLTFFFSAEGMSSNVITHELTSSGPFSKVYRASIGPYTIAMKELSAGYVSRSGFHFILVRL